MSFSLLLLVLPFVVFYVSIFISVLFKTFFRAGTLATSCVLNATHLDFVLRKFQQMNIKSMSCYHLSTVNS